MKKPANMKDDTNKQNTDQPSFKNENQDETQDTLSGVNADFIDDLPKANKYPTASNEQNEVLLNRPDEEVDILVMVPPHSGAW